MADPIGGGRNITDMRVGFKCRSGCCRNPVLKARFRPVRCQTVFASSFFG